MAVEELDVIGEGLDGIVVARVLETRPVEGANKIHMVVVDAGDGEPLEVGCGAFNMTAGDLVPLATIGTVMPNGMEIGRRKMAGVWSNGMLCSSQELGLGDDHGGIFLLPGHLEPGRPFTEAMGIERDVLYDLEINPNRPDAMSIAGVARDLAARVGVPFALPSPSPSLVPAASVSGVSCEILDPDRCGRFEARVLQRCDGRPRRPEAGHPPGPARHAVDQQRGRRVELRDARARSAQPPVRPGQGRRPRLPGAGRPRRRAAHHPRRRRARPHAPRTCSSVTATMCPLVWPGSWAARPARSMTPPPTSCSRWRGSTRSGS